MGSWKKKLLILLVIFVVFVLIKMDVNVRYGISINEFIKHNTELTSEEISVISEKPIIVGLYDDPPLSFTNEFNNYNSGIVVDYISQLAIETRSNMNLKVRPKDAIIDSLNNNEVDVIVIENNKENSEKMNLSIPLCVVKTKILVPTNSDIDSLQSIGGKKLVVLRKDNINGKIFNTLSNFAQIELVEVDNIYQCFAMLRNKSVDGFVGDDMEAAHFLNVTNKTNNYKFLDFILMERELSLGTHKDSDQLLNIINKGIIEMKKKNLIVQTQYKWLGDFETDSLDLSTVQRTYNVVLGVLLLIGVFSTWNYSITQKVNAKTRELSESKEELRLIIDTMQNGLIVVDDNLGIIECNDSIERLSQMPRESLIDKKYDEVESLKPFLNEQNMNKLTNIGNDYYYITKQKLSHNKKLIMIEDYTDKYHRERSARQESKMIAIGQLSAGLAHEIRNPLGLIKSYNFLIKKNTLNDLSYHAVKVIDNSVDRINKLIENLLRFSKLSNNEVKYVNLCSLFDDIIESKKDRVCENNIIFQLKVNADCKQDILLNEDVLRMTINNILDNGIDALKGKEGQTKEMSIEVEAFDKKLFIKISDNGCGIGKEDIDKIFDPFYSTKENGTGLGLYIISSELMNNNGSITVESEVDKGTTFDIQLPIMG